MSWASSEIYLRERSIGVHGRPASLAPGRHSVSHPTRLTATPSSTSSPVVVITCTPRAVARFRSFLSLVTSGHRSSTAVAESRASRV